MTAVTDRQTDRHSDRRDGTHYNVAFTVTIIELMVIVVSPETAIAISGSKRRQT